MRTWTLAADVSAGQLADIIRDYLPLGQIAPGVTDGAYASVSAVGGDQPPEWMSRLVEGRPDIQPVIQ